MVKYLVLCLTALLILSGIISPAAAAGPQASPFLQLSVEDLTDACRLTLISNYPIRSSVEKNGIYLLVRIRADQPFRIRRNSFRSRYIDSIGWTEGADFYVLNVKVRMSDFKHATSSLTDPPRLVIDVLPEGIDPQPEAGDAAEETAPPVPEIMSL